MALWQKTLNIVDVWPQAQRREITPQKLAAIIAERLGALKYANEYVDNRRDELVQELHLFADEAEGEVDFDDFDDIMTDIYNWADLSLDGKPFGKKVCWIKVF